MYGRNAGTTDGGLTVGIPTPARVGLVATICAVILGCQAGEPGRSTPSTKRQDPPLGRIEPAPNVPGDPGVGRRLFVSTGCAGCHTVYDVATATGVAGPNLSNVVLRPTLAGESIPMTPTTLADFLSDPSESKPGTAMPDVGLTADEAQHIAAFLYSQPYNPPR
jgi:cytochrome c2